MMSTSHHVDVAAYVLGILDEPDDAAFAQHLTHCHQCRTEYRELSDLPVLLDQLKPGPSERTGPHSVVPSEQSLNHVLDRITTSRRRQRGALWLSAAAAAVLLIAVPLIALLPKGNDGSVANAPPASSAVAPTTTVEEPSTTTPTVAGAKSITGTNPQTGLTATITVQDEPWGTKVNMELRGIKGPLQCQLVAVSRDGYSQVVSSWFVPSTGFGVPGAPLPLKVGGGVGIDQEDIERFQVLQTDGPNLLEVPT